jgi:hypothetical protein
MQNTSKTPNNTRSLIIFFALAYIISWSVGVPLALQTQGIIPPLLPLWSHYLVAYGPLLSAIFVTWNSQGSYGLRQLGKHLVENPSGVVDCGAFTVNHRYGGYSDLEYHY